MYEYMYGLCVCLRCVYAWCWGRPEGGGITPPGVEVVGSWEPEWGSWEPNLGPME